MSRPNFQMTDIKPLKDEIEHLKLKLSIKTETILKLGKDLERYEKEKHSHLSRCSTLERNLERAEMEVEQLLQSEKTVRNAHKTELDIISNKWEQNEKELQKLRAENKELKNEKFDLQKDCKIFRQQIAKYEVEKINEMEKDAIKRTNRVNSGDLSDDISAYEKLYYDFKRMESDLHTVLGVKEELIKERETLMKKVERLSAEMTYLLNGDSRRVAEDLDTVLAENRFLKAQLSTAHEESESIKSTLAKYRSMAEAMPQSFMESSPNKDTSISEKNSVAVVNMKQIRELLTSQAIELDDSDLRAITTILLDVCNDRQMALTHLRRANKVLGTRLHEVETKLQAIESRSLRSASPRVVETGSLPECSTSLVVTEASN